MITIAHVDRPIPELEYDGTEGYVIEDDGEFADQHETLEAAKLAAGADVEWRRAEAVDWAGRTYWEPVAQWTTADAAEYLGVTTDSLRRYRVRDETFPAPDGMLGRTPWWRPATIKAWQAKRPGRTGRPPLA